MTPPLSQRTLQHIAIQAKGERNLLWRSLPLELQRIILQSLVNSSTSEELPIAIYTSVSKEWQRFFEPSLWRKLTFRPWTSKSNIKGFRRAIRSHQRSLIQTISLCLRMEEYRCHRCLREVGGQHTLIEREKVLFEGLKEIFSILAVWNKDIPKSGITLELSGVAISNTGDQNLRSRGRRRRCVHPRSPNVPDELAEVLSTCGVIRNQGPLGLVPSITTISISPTISWSCSSILLFRLRNSLPCLQRLDFEQQLGTAQTIQQAIGNQKAFLLAERVHSLQRLSIWQPRSKLISEARSQSDSEKANGIAAVLQTAVSASFHLKELSITYVIDARHFFSHFNISISSGQALPYCMLERLVLSCQLGRLSVSPVEIDCLLAAASQAATRMPNLKMLEVWSPGIGEGFFFRYEVKENEINFKMAATWQFDVNAWQHGRGYRTLRGWEEVASRYTDRRFNCTIDSIEPAALPHLYSICRTLKSFTFIRKWRRC